jgi:hypothetical protein
MPLFFPFPIKYHFSSNKQPLSLSKEQLSFVNSSNNENYNNLNVIEELHRIANSLNKISNSSTVPSPEDMADISHNRLFRTVHLDYEQKQTALENILHSEQRNLYRIVDEIIIVLESFAQLNKKELIESNLIKIIKEFNNKLISTHL